ncbi:MAG: hypothetical protein EBR82_45775 [Caulobacteraceae bacterium]|nr:hypothetical protein [Caulobacteraceae bacterium]
MTLREALERSQGHIEQLEPGFKKRVAKWFQECWSKKLYVLVYCSRRTAEEQEELYKKGRVPGHPGPKVTNARGYPECQSMHCYGRAVDFVPLVETATKSFIAGWDDEESYEIAHKIAEATGGLRRLDWETPHLEDDRISGWRELVSPQRQEAVKEKKKSVPKKNPWASR